MIGGTDCIVVGSRREGDVSVPVTSRHVVFVHNSRVLMNMSGVTCRNDASHLFHSYFFFSNIFLALLFSVDDMGFFPSRTCLSVFSIVPKVCFTAVVTKYQLFTSSPRDACHTEECRKMSA